MKKISKNNDLTFEEHLENAKSIIEKLESGSCNLDKMLNLYEHAVESIKICDEKLSDFENKIKIIKKQSASSYEIDDE